MFPEKSGCHLSAKESIEKLLLFLSFFYEKKVNTSEKEQPSIGAIVVLK